ncbi:MAG: type II secretory pathway component PulF, partial [Verrucomicrobiales bacterium]
MQSFRYRALKMDGSKTEGVLEAADRSEAIRRLNRGGMQPLSINPDNGAAAKQKEKESPVAVGQEAPPATPESEKPSTPMEKGAKKE